VHTQVAERAKGLLGNWDGYGTNTQSLLRDQRNLSSSGQLVDVGGYHLRLNVMGEAKGGPTVMLDSGAQSASFQWGWVQPQIAEGPQVVAFDRAGWSAFRQNPCILKS
jgi:hypothetical protein